MGGGVQSDTWNLGHGAQAWDGRWTRGRARRTAGEGAWRSPERFSGSGARPQAPAGPACGRGPPEGNPKPFHVNQKTAEASLTLPGLAVDQELPGTASTLNFP